ncbi:MAG TPA: hypothetical protein VJ863_05610 [Sphaerochaeta sp.]|nr:hypothetical protein [Sphaerochaeta sp.]
MKKERFATIILILVLLLYIPPLFARENTFAAGFQVGFAATGAIVDIGLGPIYMNAGINYPLGYTYIAANSEEGSEAFPKVATLTLDVSTAFALSDNFDIKLGLGGILLTDFGPIAGGLAGPVIKGEYWIPNKNYGLFLNINIPVMLFGILIDDAGGDTAAIIDFNPLYPLLGLLTTSVGVLYSF